MTLSSVLKFLLVIAAMMNLTPFGRVAECSAHLRSLNSSLPSIAPHLGQRYFQRKSLTTPDQGQFQQYIDLLGNAESPTRNISFSSFSLGTAASPGSKKR
jgi:hypothetical protein